MKKTTAPTAPRTFTTANVGDLLLEGHRVSHIFELLAAEGVAKKKADDLVAGAIEDLVDDASRLDENARRGWLLAAAKSIYRRQVELGDLTGATTTIKIMGNLKRPMSRAELQEQAQALELYDEAVARIDP